ncbi:hypothetical protein NKJ88_01415 [Mesorhizobium sp. M0016]|uniref:hypothetical protein n=1 Tax=Mesorhizobium sp. M0016 TaxID=2956843 RepID=UPI00333D3AC9
MPNSINPTVESEFEVQDRNEMAGFREQPSGLESTPLDRPWSDVISRKAYDFVLRWETGGRAYHEQVIKGRPVWPEYSSGITIGCGYDLGYHTLPQFQADWGRVCHKPSSNG